MDYARLLQVKKFYRKYRRLPSYSEMVTLLRYATKSAVNKLIGKWIGKGYFEKMNDKLSPTPKFFSLPLLGSIKAGKPTPAEDYPPETLFVGEYFPADPESTFILRVSGDSMVDAGIHEGDLVIINSHREPKAGDIVAAYIDQAWTLKYFQKDKKRVFLKAANSRYQPIYPKNELILAGVVIKVMRNY